MHLYLFHFLLHEVGHLIAAKLTGMRVRSCTIMPYGGELVIPGRHIAPKKGSHYCRARRAYRNDDSSSLHSISHFREVIIHSNSTRLTYA